MKIKKTKKTNITLDEMNAMTDAEFLTHLREYPFYRQYEHSEVYRNAENRLARINGYNYMKHGHIEDLIHTSI